MKRPMDPAEVKRRHAFYLTPIGQAFRAWENAHGRAWMIDSTSDNDRRLTAAWEREATTRDALFALLMPALGFRETTDADPAA